MTDERVIKLLEEIRDLQKLHVENYKDALANQRESIEISKQWQLQTQRRLRAVLVVLVLAGGLLYALPYILRWAFSR